MTDVRWLSQLIKTKTDDLEEEECDFLFEHQPDSLEDTFLGKGDPKTDWGQNIENLSNWFG